MSCVAIIPTTGAPTLGRAARSVLAQRSPTACYVVCDGERYAERTRAQLAGLDVALCVLPLNTGAVVDNSGHRIYASFPHLVDQDHVLLLDEDNWLEPDHTERCLDLMESRQLQWCHSLRNIVDAQGRYLCRDDCESLGRWASYAGPALIDTSCWFARREHVIHICHVWHGAGHSDRRFTRAMMQAFPQFDCTGYYTANYTLSTRGRGASREFFEGGNALAYARHGPHPPWRAAACPAHPPGGATLA